MIVVFTELGELTVKGADLHISRLSLEMGELAVEGRYCFAFLRRTVQGKPRFVL